MYCKKKLQKASNFRLIEYVQEICGIHSLKNFICSLSQYIGINTKILHFKNTLK